MDLAKVVTTDATYQWNEGTNWSLEQAARRRPGQRLHVVAYDFGIKRNILRLLSDHGCRMTVVPAQTPADDVLDLNPDGVFLSNGPGDPEPCTYAIEAIQRFLAEEVPVFGICLGHQLLGLAVGARTIKMKFGHHGANHPVIDLDTGQVFISSQNHGFAVDEASLPDTVRPTHRSLFDGSLQGLVLHRPPGVQLPGPSGGEPGPARSRADVFTVRRVDAAQVGDADAQTGLIEEPSPDAQAHRPAEHPDHRRRPDRHRPGLRVRLLRRAGLQGAARGGLPGHPGELQPRDDHDRPRDGRRGLHRADQLAHGRPDHREGEAGRAAADDGRPDGAQLRSRPRARRRARRSTAWS